MYAVHSTYTHYIAKGRTNEIQPVKLSAVRGIGSASDVQIGLT